MQDTYNEGIKANPSMGNPRKGIYQERKLTTTGMPEMPEFENWFKQYHLQWMTTTLGKFNPALVREFCATYKGELKRLYLQDNFWKGGEPLSTLTIRGVR